MPKHEDNPSSEKIETVLAQHAAAISESDPVLARRLTKHRVGILDAVAVKMPELPDRLRWAIAGVAGGSALVGVGVLVYISAGSAAPMPRESSFDKLSPSGQAAARQNLATDEAVWAATGTCGKEFTAMAQRQAGLFGEPLAGLPSEATLVAAAAKAEAAGIPCTPPAGTEGFTKVIYINGVHITVTGVRGDFLSPHDDVGSMCSSAELTEQMRAAAALPPGTVQDTRRNLIAQAQQYCGTAATTPER